MDTQDLFNLLSGNKFERRKALKGLSPGTMENNEEIEKLEAILISILSDESEMNRTLACQHLQIFIDSTSLQPRLLCALMTMINHRIGNAPVEESSEDVHYLLVSLIMMCIDKQETELLKPYLNEIINVFKVSLMEKSPEILMETMDAAIILAINMADIFHLQSESLLKPLFRLLKHQRFKIRGKAIDVLGYIMKYGNIGDVRELAAALECSMTDTIQVKLSLLNFGSLLAMKMKERYSFWPQILPFVLFGLQDENPEVKEKSETIWRETGAQFEQENEEELKSQMSFQNEVAFPIDEPKFGVGCEELVYRSLHSLMKKLRDDVHNWKEKTRMWAIKLITSLVLSGKRRIIQYSAEIIEYIFFAGGDEDINIRKQACICANYMAYFIPPSVYIPCLEKELEYHSGSFYYTCRHVVEGTPIDSLKDHVPHIMSFLTYDKVQDIADTTSLLAIVEHCVQANPDSKVLSEIIESLLYLESRNDHAKHVLSKLVSVKGIDSREKLVSDATESILKRLLKTAHIWTESCPELAVAQSIIVSKGTENHLDIVLELLKLAMRPSDCPIVSYKLIESIRMKIVDCGDGNINEILEAFSSKVIKEFLNNLLPWKAGKTAEALRTASISCILSIVSHTKEQTLIFDAMQTTLKLIPKLIIDDCEINRALVCQLIKVMSSNLKTCLSEDTYFLFTKVLIERLEDKNDAVRLAAADGILSTLRVDSEAWRSNKYQIEGFIDSLFIYADDSQDRVSSLVLGALKTLTALAPNHTLKLVDANEKLFRNQSSLTELSNHIQEMKIS